ncbi:hypothetical protein D9757_003641 [Collybiopsis confluens]|uniref:GST N-terminal domain-containing protein n=1 Tax=Collybiopsis confluens TaxID=2823264 RepID=A0A8H5HUR2_9AGAR|nr:hypothetical protein D9757_003641 [Collybiopsis confluens]
MSDNTTIIFYDISFAEPNVCWSPNTWKTRFCLNYKGLSYRTEWVEYPDIESVCRRIGAAPTHKTPVDVIKVDVTPAYTFPVIYDPTTKRAISESFEIALYLDATYPNTPRLIPPGTHDFQLAFVSLAMLRIIPHAGPLMRVKVFKKLAQGRSQEYFRRTREAMYGKKIEEFEPEGEASIEVWKGFQAGLQLLDEVARKETGGDYLHGANPIFADFALAGIFQWCKAGFGADSEQWKEIMEWQDGRWAAFVARLDKYTQV